MSITVTCENCQQPWAVVPGIRKAHPGHTSEPRTVLVPDEDVFGNRLGMVQRQTAHWISDGPSAVLTRVDDGGPTWADTWTCLCGTTLAHTSAAWETVPCQHNAGTTGMCAVRAIRVNPPHDLYVNARYGGACPCCGHQGTHLVRRGTPAPCGVLAPTAP